jgi:hypothetical protein
MLLGNSITSS